MNPLPLVVVRPGCVVPRDALDTLWNVEADGHDVTITGGALRVSGRPTLDPRRFHDLQRHILAVEALVAHTASDEAPTAPPATEAVEGSTVEHALRRQLALLESTLLQQAEAIADATRTLALFEALTAQVCALAACVQPKGDRS